MTKLFIAGVFLLLFPVINNNFLHAQITVGAGTHWMSTGSTYVVLDNLGLQYDASTISPGNIFKFTGSNDVNLNGATFPTYYSIELAKNGTAKLHLLRNITVAQSISFQGGLLDLNSYNITLAPAALLLNENENSRIVSTSGGYINTSTSLNAPVSVNPGNMGAIITSSQNLGLVTIRRGHTSQTNGSGGGSSIFRYYDITPANNSNLNATLRFHYFDAELNGLTESGLVLWKSSNNITWTNNGFTSRNTTTNYVEKTGIADFSRWTLSSNNSVLPVTGLRLTGAWRNNTAVLNWTTAAEYDNDHFDIERKLPAVNSFNKIAEVRTKHADGNSQSLTAYEYTDASVNAAGTILYRLKQVDKNGQYQYSNTVAVKPDAKDLFILSVYPTVVTGNSIFIQAGNLNIPKMLVRLFDMNGRLVLNKECPYQSQLLSLPVMSSGVYRLTIRWAEWEYSLNLVKQ